jgi:hypothetical protein
MSTTRTTTAVTTTARTTTARTTTVEPPITVETNIILDAGDHPEEPHLPEAVNKPLTTTRKPVEKPAQRPVQKPTQKPVQKPAQKPVQKPTQKPENKPSDETEVEDTEALAIDCTNQDFVPSNVDCRKVN